MADVYKATLPPCQVVRAPVLGCGTDWPVRCQTSETCRGAIYHDASEAAEEVIERVVMER